jgi:hypothetical protein
MPPCHTAADWNHDATPSEHQQQSRHQPESGSSTQLTEQEQGTGAPGSEAEHSSTTQNVSSRVS